jgi:hypothetical protein
MKTKPSRTSSPAVLCGTDFSTNSAQAADAACALAKLLHAPLELVHVSEIPTHSLLEKNLADEAARVREQGAVVHASILAGIPDEELVKPGQPQILPDGGRLLAWQAGSRPLAARQCLGADGGARTRTDPRGA